MDHVKLVLQDGTEMLGHSFGTDICVGGEVVFNTGMTGYVETLTDPSYRGQILVLTSPLVGNYGVPSARNNAQLLEPPFESSQIQVQGLVVQHYVEEYSHYSACRSLGDWLQAESIPGVTGIDTRTLTRHLRASGTMRGWLVPGHMNVNTAVKQARAVDMKDEVFRLVAPEQVATYGSGDLNVVLIDVGAKDNIVRSLISRGLSVTRVPWNVGLDEYLDDSDGVMIGNGPGDPEDLTALIVRLRELFQTYEKPVFGICLGHQLMALAAGAQTYKLPYGHRSCNQPVQDLLTRRCFITSQNHGFAVSDDSMPADWEPWFVNVNDGTNEGIRSLSKPFFSVQFHPEAHPGPRDTGFLFDDFVRLIAATAQG